MDRFDLIILLKIFIKHNQGLKFEKIIYEQLKNNRFRKLKKIVDLKYSLIVLDEVQNYISEQIKILKSLVDKDTESMIYVGDLKQQTHLFTINNWQEVGEDLNKNRIVVLEKVYRSTQNILKYIASVGFKIEISESLESGEKVVEEIIKNKQQEIDYVEDVLEKNKKFVVGIISKQQEYLDNYKNKFANNSKVKIMTINEAQGVEFDVLILVGMNKEFYQVSANYDDKLLKEKLKINKDLIYVALTRAMNKLYVLGTDSIKQIFEDL